MVDLKKIFLFENVPDAPVQALLERDDVKSREFAKAESIYDPMHYQRCMGIILRGSVEVYNTVGHRVLLNVLTVGQTFGVATIFYDAGFYVSHVVAKTRCEVLFIPQEALKALFLQSIEAVENYIAFLSGRIYFLNRKIDAFTKEGAEQRLAMYLADQAQSSKEGLVVLPFGMNKLAELLSVGRASLYRAEQALADKGLIERKGRSILILDLERLSKI